MEIFYETVDISLMGLAKTIHAVFVLGVQGVVKQLIDVY